MEGERRIGEALFSSARVAIRLQIFLWQTQKQALKKACNISRAGGVIDGGRGSGSD